MSNKDHSPEPGYHETGETGDSGDLGHSGPGDRESRGRRLNHLATEASPYLRQHAHNPVDWYPWGEEALDRAKREDKAIFLSIGYSACHWCHVMERESFEDEGIAALLNDRFISIKVDREERPDLDEIYMSAVQLMTGQGGWPMSVWLTPGLKPFFGGTYFPPDDRYGRPGFARILERIAEAFRDRREELESGAERLVDRLAGLDAGLAGPGMLSAEPIEACADALRRSFDSVYGGFGQAPKFPHSMGMQCLLRDHLRRGDPESLRMVTFTLDRMAQGGIYDHLAGGFHRYSTDPRWLAPHFEKMLYDQALLVVAYLEAFQVTGSALYRKVIEETLDFVLHEMTSPEGGFYSTLDADSEGVEGKYYVWTPAEVDSLLGEADGALFRRAYDVEEGGNFEGRSILRRMAGAESLAAFTGRPAEEIEASLARARTRLWEHRRQRVAPFRDEKILAAWNGLMVSAFARAGAALGNARYVQAAERACDFVLSHMRLEAENNREHPRLLRVWQDGRVHIPAYLDDYASMTAALTDAYEATFEPRWLNGAEGLAAVLAADFLDPVQGAFFHTSEGHRDLIVRMKNAQDGSTPSGNSLAASALLRLARLTGRTDLESQAVGILRAFEGVLTQAPAAVQQMIIALDFYLGPPQEIAIVGPRAHPKTRALLAAVRETFLPGAVVAWTNGTDVPTICGPLLEAKTLVGGEPAAYLCRDFTCAAPMTEPEALRSALRAQSRRASS